MKINDSLSYEKIDGQIVILNEKDEVFGDSKALILNNSATFIFECLQNELDGNAIVKKMMENFGICEITAKTDLTKCLELFINKRILVND